MSTSTKSKAKKPVSRKKKPQSRLQKWLSTPKLLLPVLFVLIFASIGVWQLVASHAEVIDRGTVAYMQTSDGCWLAGRVWNGSSCTTSCRSAGSTYVAKTTTHLGYCTGAIAPAVGETACTNYGRRYVSGTGCSRRVDQQVTAGANQCRWSNNTYFPAGTNPDYCGLVCNGTRYMNITTCPAAPAPTGGTTGGTTSTTFSVWNRDSVNNTYKSLWASGAGVPQYWNGNVSTCNAGNISDAARVAMINAVNFARTVNYLEPIHGIYSQTAANNLAAQQTALMMEANDTLNHNPPASWKCYTSLGATTAGQSNLGINSFTPLDAIRAQLDEPGPANYYVGHRRWLLYPDANNFGFGMTSRAVAVKVTGLPTDTTNPDPLWTMWPSRGYFPSPLEPAGRWSVSTKAKANLKYATVRVTHNGVGVPVSQYPVVNEGSIRSTLVWTMPAGSDSGNYSVTISGLRKPDGTIAAPYTYPVYFFTPY